MHNVHANDRIIIDPKVCHGKPTIRGTRTPVAVVLGHLAGGDDFETVQKQYDLTGDDIRACIAFANDELSRMTFAPTIGAA
jgi:uncharacterized protein (DUF433 family)